MDPNSDEKKDMENTQETAQNNDNSKKKELIKDREIEEEMKSSYLDYAMSVIVSRALPDARDGLKPVHRRILYAMHDMGMLHNKPFKKSARIVGECLGKYHPHGDSAVYDSMVRMAQEFSLRYPLVHGQGNFGSIDGDNAAAMRYTEARMQKIAEEMLQDIDKNTVEFVPNFDGSLKEPSVMPSKFPNLLANGSSGIAVGMATNIPPHNMAEILDGVMAYIENPEIEIVELMRLVKGPDFPTGATICGRAGIKRAYQTGKGHLRVRAKTEIEEGKKNKIIVKEIPYQVNKSLLIEEIADLVRDKKINGISDIRDESDRTGMRIVIVLKKDESPEIILNQLYKHSRLQTTFGINMLALVNNEPKVLNLKQAITQFVKHRQIVVRRRTEFELDKAEKRAHILEGLIIALNDIDNAIELIKKSKTAEEARKGLMSQYTLTEIQAQAILDMKLQRLTNLEQDKIRNEQQELIKLIGELKAILADEQKILDIIKKESEELKNKYGDERRTVIEEAETDDIETEDLIKEEDMVVTVSHAGYIKRLPIDTYKQQRRGGKGIIGATTKEEDWIENLFIANTHAYLLFFTDKGQVYWLKVYSIPEASRQAKGKAIVNLINLKADEKITAILPVKDFDPEKYIVMATKQGVIKKTNLSAYSKPRQGGIIAINLDSGDTLVGAMITDGYQKIMLTTQNGIAVKFDESEARPVGRASRGSRGINLREGDKVIGLVRGQDEKTLFTITENGYGKRTKILEYRQVGRGSKGVINIICSERNGKAVATRSITDDDELVLTTQKGITIRIPAHQISTIGRNTQGMRIMKLSHGDKAAAAAKIVSEEKEEVEESEE